MQREVANQPENSNCFEIELQQLSSRAVLVAVVVRLCARVADLAEALPELLLARVLGVGADARSKVARRVVHAVFYRLAGQKLANGVVRHTVDIRRAVLIVGFSVGRNLERHEG